MSIRTEAGNEVIFLGFSKRVRTNVINALFANPGADVGSAVINTGIACYVGLSSTEPDENCGNICEPEDENYARVFLTGQETTDHPYANKFLSFDGPSVINNINGVPTEIKFNRSKIVWDKEYPYFFLSSSKKTSGSTDPGMMAWGKLKDPIVVDAINKVPLFEEGKFRLAFPAPSAVEIFVDAAAAADANV